MVYPVAGGNGVGRRVVGLDPGVHGAAVLLEEVGAGMARVVGYRLRPAGDAAAVRGLHGWLLDAGAPVALEVAQRGRDAGGNRAVAWTAAVLAGVEVIDAPLVGRGAWWQSGRLRHTDKRGSAARCKASVDGGGLLLWDSQGMPVDAVTAKHLPKADGEGVIDACAIGWWALFGRRG